MTRPLIVASDLSERSLLALQSAPVFAERMGAARIILLHVVDDVVGSSVAEAEVEIESAQLALEAARLAGPPIETRVLVGTPDEAILRFAGEVGAGLILTGTPRPRRFLEQIRGTTTERLMRRAACPVAMVLRPMPAVRPAVLFASDLSPRAARALGVLAGLGLTREVALRIVTADDMPLIPTGGVGMDGSDPLDPEGYRRDPALEAELRRCHPPGQFASSSVDYIAAQGPAARVIRRLARSGAADLVAIATRGRGLLSSLAFGSTAAQLVGRPVSNLLVVPDGAAAAEAPAAGPVLAALDPTDPPSHAGVLARAEALAADRGAPVVAVAVVEGGPRHGGASDRLRRIADAISATEAKLSAWIAGAGRAAVAVEVVHGAADEELLRAADRLGAQLIVIGAPGDGPEGGYGSVAQRVRDGAACEIVTVSRD